MINQDKIDSLSELLSPCINSLQELVKLDDKSQVIASKNIDSVLDKLCIITNTKTNEYDKVTALYMYTTYAYYNDLYLRKVKYNDRLLGKLEVINLTKHIYTTFKDLK